MKKPSYYFALLLLIFTSVSFTSPTEGYQVGDKVNDFKLKNVDGNTLSLSDNKAAKGYIVVIMANTCPVVKAYEERIISLHDKYSSQGYPVIAINPNDVTRSPGDSFEEMKKKVKEKGYAFPYLADETQEVTKALGASSTPTAFIVTKKGPDFILAYRGAIDNNFDKSRVSTKFVEIAMTEILSGKIVSTQSTKAFGCGIKWKES